MANIWLFSTSQKVFSSAATGSGLKTQSLEEEQAN